MFFFFLRYTPGTFSLITRISDKCACLTGRDAYEYPVNVCVLFFIFPTATLSFHGLWAIDSGNEVGRAPGQDDDARASFHDDMRSGRNPHPNLHTIVTGTDWHARPLSLAQPVFIIIRVCVRSHPHCLVSFLLPGMLAPVAVRDRRPAVSRSQSAGLPLWPISEPSRGSSSPLLRQPQARLGRTGE